MAETIYALCALTAFLCSWMLLRAYGRTKNRLLFWSGLCFAGLTLSNIILIIDKVFLPTEVDLANPRWIVSLGALFILLYGLIWHSE
jgi:hypothetical protein